MFADVIQVTSDVLKFQISAKLKSNKFFCLGRDCPYLVIERAEGQKEGVKVLQT